MNLYYFNFKIIFENQINRLLFNIYCITNLVHNSKIKKLDNSKNASNYKIEQILDNYGNSIIRMAYSYLHNMNDAEDILQETLIKYMRNAPFFENTNHEKAWLLKVSANLSKNLLKYKKIRNTDELSELLFSEENSDLTFVWEAVKSLPESYREAIHLFYHEGFSTKEISKTLNRKESSIRSDLKRDRDKLRVLLKERFDFE